MPINLAMPSLGESVIEGTITKWLVREGDSVKREQPVVSVATDKADSDIPAPQDGRIAKILASEGATVKVGDPLCVIEPGSAAVSAVSVSSATSVSAATSVAPAGATVPAPPPEGMSVGPVPESAEAPRSQRRSAAAADEEADNGSLRTGRSSPVVRKLALEHGVNLEQVQGSGARGRVTREDVMKAAETRPADVAQPARGDGERVGTAAGAVAGAVASSELAALLSTGVRFPAPNAGYGSYRVPAYRPKEGDQVIPFSRRRRLTADHMVYSKLTAPHVVTVAEVDLHKASRLREANKERYKRDGVSLTMLAFVSVATVRALQEFPGLNARVLDDAYVLLKDINLGIAVDAPEGLVVPNIKRADELSLKGLGKAIDELAARAKAGKITADDLAGCTFSISNPGIRGNLFGGAIIAQPNAGILRMGEIQKRVMVVEVEGQDTMAIHPVMYLALSYDHRIIDGVLANSFLHRVTELLEGAEFEV